ncbi:hypothetical protein RDI58_008504 [Solanum bulbocastanum]|uniref:Autophagy-related protein 16 domain-containing protein n=1 Tax=Solanum bulbocastanum TaxID=147425 RepID=A0AAN8U2J2_SOLBU
MPLLWLLSIGLPFCRVQSGKRKLKILKASKSLVPEKETLITDLQNELNSARDECSRLTELLEEKSKALELIMSEHQDLKAQREAVTRRAEIKILVDRWRLQKMQDAERLNESNALYENMLDKFKDGSIQKFPHPQVNGVVPQSEDAAEPYFESSIPSTCWQRIPAHDGGCASILFEYTSSKLISGGQDREIKIWDTRSGSLSNILYGCLGSVLDLSITPDNKFIIAAISSNDLNVWDANSGRIHHILTGHINKVCAVDVSRSSSRYVVSAAYDRTIKVWDLQKGYCNNTIIFHSNCNSLSLSTDGLTLCSGHVDGNLRLWDVQTGKLLGEVAAHSQAVTSVSLSQYGNMILTSGRDNLHNLFDIRTFEICGTFRSNANRVASNWTRSRISPDESYVSAGSVDGSVHIWAYEEVAIEAIKHALKALRKRHLVEEEAHAPALAALNRPFVLQGSEWKEKAENLEVELQQCYKAQARLSEQLVVEVAESRASKSLLQEKETLITDLQNELNQARDECSHLTELLGEKTKALELLMAEHQDLKAQIEAITLRANNAEAENKTLVDRWMLQKMQDAERLNEANALYGDMLDKVKVASIEKLARQQVDGVVRQSEDGAEFYVESSIPSTCKQRIPAHDGGCASILFEYNSSKLISGGQDRAIKMWDTTSGSLTNSFYGCLGSVLDLSITHDNKFIIAASSSNNLYVWDANSGRIRHTLTGHIDKVCAVDVSKFSSRYVVSAAYDRTIKVWDLQKGYCNNTIIFHSNCNSLAFSMDALTICSGHVDGNLRLWDVQTGKLLSEVAAHSQAVTSVSLSRNGNMILTSGRDNLHNLFDIRTLEICGTFRSNANRVASNWSRSCISADDGYVTAGSVDGSVHIWSVSNGKMVSTLKEHTSSVLCCSWSGLGNPLATSDKSGTICIWS